MTREDVAEKIRWGNVIWIAGLVNVGAMFPQLYRIITTRNTDGLSLSMFCMYLVLQIFFALEGYFKRNAMLKWCFAMSAVVSATIITLVIYLRHSA